MSPYDMDCYLCKTAPDDYCWYPTEHVVESLLCIVGTWGLAALGWYLVVRPYIQLGNWLFPVAEAELSDNDELEAENCSDAASNATVETLAYSGDGADDAWSACGTV
jgi:hypothetical protein